MINCVNFMGRIGKQPELRQTKTGKFTTSFTIGVARDYHTGEEKKTDWFDCTAWNKGAEFIAKYFHKGDMIAIVGRMETDDYIDKDGNKKKSYTVIVDRSSFCGAKRETEAPTPNIDVVVDEDGYKEITEDDLPF